MKFLVIGNNIENNNIFVRRLPNVTKLYDNNLLEIDLPIPEYGYIVIDTEITQANIILYPYIYIDKYHFKNNIFNNIESVIICGDNNMTLKQYEEYYSFAKTICKEKNIIVVWFDSLNYININYINANNIELISNKMNYIMNYQESNGIYNFINRLFLETLGL